MSATPRRGSASFRTRLKPPASRSAARSSGPRTRSPGASAATSFSMSRSSTATWPIEATPGMATSRNRRCGMRTSPPANRLHPTMKPVELVERALLNSSKSGDVVVDLFGGSGTTMMPGWRRRGRFSCSAALSIPKSHPLNFATGTAESALGQCRMFGLQSREDPAGARGACSRACLVQTFFHQ